MERDKYFTSNPYKKPTQEQRLEELREIARITNEAVVLEQKCSDQVTVFFPDKTEANFRLSGAQEKP